MRDTIEGMNGQDLDGRNITEYEAQSRGSGGGGRSDGGVAYNRGGGSYGSGYGGGGGGYGGNHSCGCDRGYGGGPREAALLMEIVGIWVRFLGVGASY
ncbi:cold, circadian rhythm, and rna binding 2 [Actinidia rufa]|uniref:Cold, circadian rhythm, and rna binding 2 n=1 Tax=Actinidia rufa TaxID=165716 RepID=A0A7J0F8C3_9ERIC|nr:cold, circadian rhythm, and rna binding 2 [Actinidia rufa]